MSLVPRSRLRRTINSQQAFVSFQEAIQAQCREAAYLIIVKFDGNAPRSHGAVQAQLRLPILAPIRKGVRFLEKLVHAILFDREAAAKENKSPLDLADWAPLKLNVKYSAA